MGISFSNFSDLDSGSDLSLHFVFFTNNLKYILKNAQKNKEKNIKRSKK